MAYESLCSGRITGTGLGQACGHAVVHGCHSLVQP